MSIVQEKEFLIEIGPIPKIASDYPHKNDKSTVIETFVQKIKTSKSLSEAAQELNALLVKFISLTTMILTTVKKNSTMAMKAVTITSRMRNFSITMMYTLSFQ